MSTIQNQNGQAQVFKDTTLSWRNPSGEWVSLGELLDISIPSLKRATNRYEVYGRDFEAVIGGKLSFGEVAVKLAYDRSLVQSEFMTFVEANKEEQEFDIEVKDQGVVVQGYALRGLISNRTIEHPDNDKSTLGFTVAVNRSIDRNS